MRTLRALALQQNRKLLGLQQPIRFISPTGTVYNLKGLTNDRVERVDPQTEQLITINQPTATVHRGEFPVNDQPRSKHHHNEVPWQCFFDDDLGNERQYIVIKADPDRTIGMITCFLQDVD